MAPKHFLDFSERGKSLIGQEMFRILETADDLERLGNKVYHLELGDPKHDPPQEIIKDTIRALGDLQVGYCPSGGLLELRRRLARRFTSQEREIGVENVAVSPANLLISQFLDIVCDRGDRTVLFTPAFPTYLAVCRHLGLDARHVALSSDRQFQLTMEDVDAAIHHQPKAVIVNSGNNPTGAIYDQDVLAYLVERCTEHGCWLLNDETYLKLNYEKDSFSLLECTYPKLLTISSFSKIFAIPAFRVGYAVGAPAVIEKVILSSSTLYSCLPMFSQIGICNGLDAMDCYLNQISNYYRDFARECVELLAGFENVSCPVPDSGFYLFIDVQQTGLDSSQFSEQLLEKRHTATTPGEVFGYKGFVRASICGEANDVREGLRRLGKFSSQITQGEL